MAWKAALARPWKPRGLPTPRQYRKLEPGPFEEWLLYDHPSGRTRIAMAMQWKAEARRRPLTAPG